MKLRAISFELMGILGLGVVPLVSWIVAQATPDIPGWANLGASVVLSGICVFLITKAMPAERAEHRKDLKDAWDNHKGEQDATRAAFTETIKHFKDVAFGRRDDDE